MLTSRYMNRTVHPFGLKNGEAGKEMTGSIVISPAGYGRRIMWLLSKDV